MNRELKSWFDSRPGPFVGRTPNSVWEAAWANFNEGKTGGFDNELLFMVQLQQIGIGVRTLAVGGYALDRVT